MQKAQLNTVQGKRNACQLQHCLAKPIVYTADCQRCSIARKSYAEAYGTWLTGLTLRLIAAAIAASTPDTAPWAASTNCSSSSKVCLHTNTEQSLLHAFYHVPKVIGSKRIFDTLKITESCLLHAFYYVFKVVRKAAAPKSHSMCTCSGILS